MAGIGFELKKIFTGKSIAGTAYGYTCATVIVAGPTFLAILLLLGLEYLANRVGGSDWELLLALITYAMIGALLVSSVFTHVNAHYSADALYRNDYGRVMPSINGAYACLMVPFGLLYLVLLATAKNIGLVDKLLNFFDFAIITYVYLQLSYLTAIKKFRRLMLWFAIGIASALLFAVLLLYVIRMPLITGAELSLFLGYGILFLGNAKELYEEFPTGYGSNLLFFTYVIKYPELAICSFFTMATSFVHIIIMWCGPLGQQVTGAFRCAPIYDAAAFYGFLVAIPSTVLFVVSMEVNFYEKYRRYFDMVSLNGTLKDVELARVDMVRSLKNEILRIEIIQLIFLFAYMFFMRFYLQNIGFTQTILVIFYFLCIGYAAQGVSNSLVLVLLYFDSRRYAAIIAITGFVVCGVLSLVFVNTPELYGIGMTAAGLVMFLLGVFFLEKHLKNVDENVFCAQPIFAVEKKDAVTKFLQRHDERMIARTVRSRARREEAKRTGTIDVNKGTRDLSKTEKSNEKTEDAVLLAEEEQAALTRK